MRGGKKNIMKRRKKYENHTSEKCMEIKWNIYVPKAIHFYFIKKKKKKKESIWKWDAFRSSVHIIFPQFIHLSCSLAFFFVLVFSSTFLFLLLDIMQKSYTKGLHDDGKQWIHNVHYVYPSSVFSFIQ